MNAVKRALALLLLGSLLVLTACGNNGGSQTNGENDPGTIKGRYMETDISPPVEEGEAFSSFVTPEGSLVCYTFGLGKRFESKDNGATWEETPGPGAENEALASVETFALLPDGSILAATMDEETYTATGLLQVAPDGSVKPYAMEEFDEAVADNRGPYVSALKVIADDLLMFNYGCGETILPSGGAQEGETGEDAPPAEESAPAEEPTAESAADADAEAPEDAPDETEDSGITNYATYAGIYRLSTGEKVLDLTDKTVLGSAVNGETLYLMSDGGEVTAQNLSDGAPVSDYKVTIPVEEFAFNMEMAMDKNGTLYVLDGKRLMQVKANSQEKAASGEDAGVTPETLMDGSAYSFGDPGSAVDGLWAQEDGSLVVSTIGAAGSRLYQYRWDENATLDPSKIIHAWSLNEDSVLRAAISKFRKAHPDALVEYEVALSEGGMTPEDAIKNLNTRLINGDGPDIMILDGCPVESYASKGMLKDLSGLVDTSDIFEGMREPFETEKGTFYLPTNFKMPLLLGTEASLKEGDTLEKLVSMVEQGNDEPVSNAENDDVFAALPEGERPVFSFGDLREAFEVLWDASAPSVIQDGTLDTENLEAFLKALESISGKYKLTDENRDTQRGTMAVSTTGGSAAVVHGSPIAYSAQRAQLGAYTASDMMLLSFVMEAPGSQYTPFPGVGGGSWMPASVVGISADSEKAELAADLLTTMLGQEVQSISSVGGFPITKGGMEKQISDMDEMLRKYQNDKGFTFDYQGLVAQAKQPYFANEVLTNAVWETAEGLCQGTMDREGAMRQIEQDIKNYLAERQ